MTKIALLDSWPNLDESAELEFIKRFIIAARNLGDVEARRVVTSDDIYAFNPDAVLTLHEFSRKLTEFPTIGLLWSPLSFFADDEYRKISVQSYDGYVGGNENLRNYVEDIQFSRPICKPVGKGVFLPTSYMTNTIALESVEIPSMCYLGVHWDGSRHSRVFEELMKWDLVTLYGPSSSWQSYSHHYGGMVPFDGKSVQQTIAKHGIALCFHKKEHRQQNTPSMRIFEALSVGALPICDQIEFARTELSDVALFVDTAKSPKSIARQIAEHIQWIRENKAEAVERVRRGKEWFERKWSLEEKIKSVILPTIEAVRESGMFPSSNGVHPSVSRDKTIQAPECEVVIRAGGRDLPYLKRAIDSVLAANTTAFPLGLIIVDYKSRADIRDFIEKDVSLRIFARYITSEDNGFRSTALWSGLQAVKAPFVAHLDDDDTVHPNHYRQLLQALQKHPDSPLAYSGVIKKEDDQGRYFQAINFKGPANRDIEENRELFFLSDYDLTRLAQFDNYIQSNTWMARSEVLKNVLGDDPRLEVIEDVYLYLLLAQRGPFAFTGSATAVWHWRSSQADNSMTSVSLAKWMRDGQRVARRLENLRFHYVPDLISVKMLKPERTSSIELGGNFNIDAELEPLVHDAAVEGGSALSERVAFKGFHPAEAAGVWSKETKAQMVLKLDSEVQAFGGEVIIEFIASDTGEVGRFVEFGIEPGERQKIEARGWDVRQVILQLPPSAPEICTISVGIDSLFTPDQNMSDIRKLGVHIKSVCVASRVVQAQPIVSIYQDIMPQEPSREAIIAELAPFERREMFNLKCLDNPVLSFYKMNSYSHVSVSEYRKESRANICKIMNNSGKYSIQFDLVDLLIGEEIDKKYVEFDKGPVFRIYLNGDSDDIRRRIAALPPRLRNVVQDLAIIRSSDCTFETSRDAVEDIMNILQSVQNDLYQMAILDFSEEAEVH